jgi:co-chaperonin GroES (HSP10)
MMRKNFVLSIFTLLITASFVFGQAAAGAAPAAQQTGDQSITPNRVIGEVKAIDSQSKQLIVKTDAGSLVTATLSDTTQYMRVAPGETTLTNATKITFADLAEGDRVMAMGKVSDDKKAIPARAVVVMTKADIAKKQETERAEWRRRGILGVVSALNPATKEITISSRSMAGVQSVIIPVSDKVELRRYAPDSIKFGDAKTSTFGELQVGDQLRALGERAPDGTKFTPEKIVTGAFRTVAGTVTAVDVATGELKITETEKKVPLTIVVKQDAVLRRFPPAGEMGGMMMRPGGGGGNPAGGPPASGAPAGGAPAGGAAQGGPGNGPRRAGGFNIQDMLERLPTVSLADVKVGEMIVVSSTKGADPTRLTAISLLSGAEPLLAMIAARQPQQPSGQSAPNPAGGLGNSGIQFGIGLP